MLHEIGDDRHHTGRGLPAAQITASGCHAPCGSGENSHPAPRAPMPSVRHLVANSASAAANPPWANASRVRPSVRVRCPRCCALVDPATRAGCPPLSALVPPSAAPRCRRRQLESRSAVTDRLVAVVLGQVAVVLLHHARARVAEVLRDDHRRHGRPSPPNAPTCALTDGTRRRARSRRRAGLQHWPGLAAIGPADLCASGTSARRRRVRPLARGRTPRPRPLGARRAACPTSTLEQRCARAGNPAPAGGIIRRNDTRLAARRARGRESRGRHRRRRSGAGPLLRRSGRDAPRQPSGTVLIAATRGHHAPARARRRNSARPSVSVIVRFALARRARASPGLDGAAR